MQKKSINFFIKVKVIHLICIANKMYHTNIKYATTSSSIFVESTTSMITFATIMTLLGY